MKRLRLNRLMSYPLSAALLVNDIAAGKAFTDYRNEVKVACCTEFDDRFYTFWEALKGKNSRFLLGVRTPEVLEWHFKHALQKNEAWVFTMAAASELLAYSIFRRQDNPRFGLTRMRLVDFQTLDDNPALLMTMLSFALKRCRAEGIHMLEHIGLCPKQEEISKNLAPHRRQLRSWLYFYKVRDQNLALRLANPKVWNPSCFDGDSSL